MIWTKRMPHLLVAIVALFFIPPILWGSDSLIWPLDTEPIITSSFCEFRPGHFHAGLDMRNERRDGVACLAAGDGVVTCVRASPTGYGRALYMKLDDGRTLVYAHLQKFEPGLEELIRRRQEELRRFTVRIYLEDDQYRFRQGDVIAYSGRSATVHPHLHFEVRDSQNMPINPLLEGFAVVDTRYPRPVAVALSPLDGWSTVENDCQPRIYSDFVISSDGVYRIEQPIGMTGRIGVSIDEYDRADNASNSMAAYRIELKVNGVTRWVTAFDRFSYEETDQIETERNYRLRRYGKGVFHRLYRATGNTLQWVTGEGTIYAVNGDDYPIDAEILISDAAGNTTRVEFTLVSDHEVDSSRSFAGEPLFQWNDHSASMQATVSFNLFDDYIRLSAQSDVREFRLNGSDSLTIIPRYIEGGVSVAWIPPMEALGHYEVTAVGDDGREIGRNTISIFTVYPDTQSTISSDDRKLILEIPSGALYDTMMIRIIPDTTCIITGQLESVYRIEPRDQLLAGRVNIKIAGDGELDELGWGVCYFSEKGRWVFLGDDKDGDYYAGHALSWELFGLARDIDHPVITMEFPSDSVMLSNRQPLFKATINDSTFGVIDEGLTMRLDGLVVPAEWDPPRHRFSYEPWEELSVGEHQLEIEAVDRVGNRTTRIVHFTITP